MYADIAVLNDRLIAEQPGAAPPPPPEPLLAVEDGPLVPTQAMSNIHTP